MLSPPFHKSTVVSDFYITLFEISCQHYHSSIWKGLEFVMIEMVVHTQKAEGLLTISEVRPFLIIAASR